MKKWILVLAAIVSISLVLIYSIYPSVINVSSVIFVRSNDASIVRCLSDKQNWSKLWPEANSAAAENSFVFNKKNYLLKQTLFNSFEFQISKNNDLPVPSFIRIMPVNIDSTYIEWRLTLNPGNNPLKRVQQYQLAKSLKKDISIIMDTMHSFLDKKENVYGMKVEAKIVTDTLLVATRQTFKQYPGTGEVYVLINKLKTFILEKGASEVNPPMVHVNRLDSTRYETMVAIPVNKAIGNGTTFETKTMVPGNILVAEIKGGTLTARKAYTMLDYFVSDHRLQSPAIPFESWVTDRTKETDTSRWITKIYYPIF